MVVRYLAVMSLFYLLSSCVDLNDRLKKYPLDDLLTKQEQDSVLRESVISIEETDFNSSDSVTLNDYQLIYFLESDTANFFILNYTARGLLVKGKICYGGKTNTNRSSFATRIKVCWK